jgi:hypothetical protein
MWRQSLRLVGCVAAIYLAGNGNSPQMKPTDCSERSVYLGQPISETKPVSGTKPSSAERADLKI